MPHTIASARLDLVLMTGAFMKAVLAGDRTEAEAIGGYGLAEEAERPRCELSADA